MAVALATASLCAPSALAGRGSKPDESDQDVTGVWKNTKGFGVELEALVQEVSSKISTGLNNSYSLAMREDAKYKELRDKLRSGLDEFAKGQKSLQVEIPQEHLRKLGEIRDAMQPGATAKALKAGLSELRSSGDAVGGAGRFVAGASHQHASLAQQGVAGGEAQIPEDLEVDAVRLRRNAESLRAELAASANDEIREVESIVGRGANSKVALFAPVDEDRDLQVAANEGDVA